MWNDSGKGIFKISSVDPEIIRTTSQTLSLYYITVEKYRFQ